MTYDRTFELTDLGYGIFMEYGLVGNPNDEYFLLGYRFEDFESALAKMESMSDGKYEIDATGEHFWAVPEDSLPEGYRMMVYFIDRINEYDLKNLTSMEK